MKNRIYYNCHTHVFSKKCIPEGIIGKKYGWLVRLLDKFQMNRVAIFLLSVLKILPVPNSSIERMKIFFRSFAQGNQKDVINHLLHSEYDTFAEKGRFRMVVLTQDMDVQNAGLPDQTFANQVLEIADYKRFEQDRHRILPFLGINPYNPIFVNSLVVDFAKEYIETRGFVGIKLYPASGYYPDDYRLNELWAYCEHNEIPIMSHCTCGRVHYQGDATSRLKGADPARPKSILYPRLQNNVQVNFTDISHFQAILLNFPKLKICFAHCGGLVFSKTPKQSLQADAASGNFRSTEVVEFHWYETIMNWCKGGTYPNIYFDISWINHDIETLRQVHNDANRYGIMDKVLYGTDFFVNLDKVTEGNAYWNSCQVFDIDQIASRNPVKYLTSKFFTAVEFVKP